MGMKTMCEEPIRNVAGSLYYNELELMCRGGYDREVFVTLLSDIHRYILSEQSLLSLLEKNEDYISRGNL